MKKNRSTNRNTTFDAISTLVGWFAPIIKEAERLGILPDDRDLLECPECGLCEDVLCDGVFIVAKDQFSQEDTGLRFKRIRDEGERYRCPRCGAVVEVGRE